DRILLVDPLLHPARMRGDLNPIEHPEKHRTSTLRWITLWFNLWPWIQHDLVGFIRAPGDFFPELGARSIERTKARFRRHPELNEILAKENDARKGTLDYEQFIEEVFLSQSDTSLRTQARKHEPHLSDEQVEEFIQHVHDRRTNHPYHLDLEDGQQLRDDILQISSGTNY